MAEIFANKSINAGDILEFGRYEQGDGIKPIEWRVLAVKEGKALLISEKGLDWQPFSEKSAGTTWETCTIRPWLNETFLNTAFSDEEKSVILLSAVPADKNPEYDTDPGNATQDKIFLPSALEVKKYFTSNKDRLCCATSYAHSRGAFISDGYTYWQLRTPGCREKLVCYVVNNGSISCYGERLGTIGEAIRPAMWVEI